MQREFSGFTTVTVLARHRWDLNAAHEKCCLSIIQKLQIKQPSDVLFVLSEVQHNAQLCICLFWLSSFSLWFLFFFFLLLPPAPSAQIYQTGSWLLTRRKPSASQRWGSRCWENTPSLKSLLRNRMSLRWEWLLFQLIECKLEMLGCCSEAVFSTSAKQITEQLLISNFRCSSEASNPTYLFLVVIWFLCILYPPKKKNTPSMFVSGVCACITLQTGVFVVRNWKALPSCGGARVFFFRTLHGCRIETLGLNNGWIWFVFWCCVMQSTVDKLIKKTNLALVVGTNSWRDQFMEAITVSAGNVVCSLRHYKS